MTAPKHEFGWRRDGHGDYRCFVGDVFVGRAKMTQKLKYQVRFGDTSCNQANRREHDFPPVATLARAKEKIEKHAALFWDSIIRAHRRRVGQP